MAAILRSVRHGSRLSVSDPLRSVRRQFAGPRVSDPLRSDPNAAGSRFSVKDPLCGLAPYPLCGGQAPLQSQGSPDVKPAPPKITWETPNWRERIPLRVRNQGESYFCVAVNTATLASYLWYIKTGKDILLSSQAIVHGMGQVNGVGSSPCEALYHIARNGLFTEDDCPFTGSSGDAKEIEALLKSGKVPLKMVKSFVCLLDTNLMELREILKVHPVLICLKNNSEFSSFKGFVWEKPYKEDPSQNILDRISVLWDKVFWVKPDHTSLAEEEMSESAQRPSHVAIALAFGTGDNGTDYLLIQNSWGPRWGQEGLVAISVDVIASWGILSGMWYPEFREEADVAKDLKWERSFVKKLWERTKGYLFAAKEKVAFRIPKP